MPRYKLTLEYDGTAFAGWQQQPDFATAQDTLEAAIERFCGVRCTAVAAGRTDAGVHATGQVAHVDLPREYPPYQVMMGLNFHLLPQTDRLERKNYSLIVTHVEAVDEEFHARFNAIKRYYRYRILNRRAPSALDAHRVWHVPQTLDIEAMQAAANILIGHHDFSSFRDTQCQAKSPVKTMEEIRLTRVDEEIHIHLSARSFLHHQVRIIAGSLKCVGNGYWSVDDMRVALEAKDRRAGGPTAPPQGLCLTRVDYNY